MFENVNRNINLSQNKVTSLKRECYKPPSLYLVPKHVNKQTFSNRNGFVVVCYSVTKSCATPWTVALQASLPFTVSWSLLRFMSIESVMLSNYPILYRPLLLCLQSFSASGSFPVSQLFASGGQSIGASASTSVLLMNFRVVFL